MRGDGWNCEAVHDKLDKDLRREYIDGLGVGTMNALTSYDVLGEGVDVPILAGVIIRRLTTSLIIWLQQCGRALRVAPGKEKAIIIDQAGNVFDHGHPLEIRQWSLSGDLRKEPKKPATLKQCPQCGSWNPVNAKICPKCGYDLRSTAPQKTSNIKIIDEPLNEILWLPAPDMPTGKFAMEAADLMTFNSPEVDQALIDSVARAAMKQDPDARERLEYIARIFNHSHKWTQEVWDKYIKPYYREA